MSRRRQAFTCYGIALGLAVAVALVFRSGADGGVQILTMLTPTVAVLAMMLFAHDEQGRRSSWAELGLKRAGLRWWPVALAIPVVVVAASYGATALVHPFPWTPPPHVYARAVIALPIVSVLVFFEEVCWRGYLLPRLAPSGRPGPAAIVGFMHGVWHLPLILFTTAYNPAGSRWIVVPVFVALLSVAGVIYAWFRVLSGSLWPVVLAHAGFNHALGAAVDSSPDGDVDSVFAYVTGETGVITLLFALIATIVLLRLRPIGTGGGLSGSGGSRLPGAT